MSSETASGSSAGSLLADEAWLPEPIPDVDRLFMRIHVTQIAEDGRPNPGAFRNRDNPLDPDAPKAMSTDWCKYSTPEATRARALHSAVEQIGVIALGVAGVRALYRQRVEHSPWYQDPELPENPNNRAHTDVIGPKSKSEANGPDERIEVLGVRSGLVELSQWEVFPGQ